MIVSVRREAPSDARPQKTAGASRPKRPIALNEPLNVGRTTTIAPASTQSGGALGSFALYLGIRLGDPLAWTHAERAWGRRFTPIGLVTAVERLPQARSAWVHASGSPSRIPR